jgi:hypothetical protein
MKILILESPEIEEVVERLVGLYDPDYPAGDGTGLSKVINETLAEVLQLLSPDVVKTLPRDHEHYELVMILLNDPHVVEVAMLKWNQAIVEDTRGTIVLIF